MVIVIDDSVITCDEIVDKPETVWADSINKKAIFKTDYHILHTFCTPYNVLLLKIIVTV